MVDILDVVVPAYSAGITVDLLDYHKINGKKTVDKYVDIQQEQLEEVISYWDDERRVQQATFFAAENGNPGRVVVVMCSLNYNYTTTAVFSRNGLGIIKKYVREIVNTCTVQEKSGNPIEALHDIWFGKKEKPEHEDVIDALRYAVTKALADSLNMPIEMLDPNDSYEFDTESGKLTNAQHEEMKNILRTMAIGCPEDIRKQV